MILIANFSNHPLVKDPNTRFTLAQFFGTEDISVTGHMPILPDIGKHDKVKAAVALYVQHVRALKPTHMYIACHPAFDALIYQCVSRFHELQVPRLLRDSQRGRFWISPSPFTRQEMQDIECGTGDIPVELSLWFSRLKEVA